MDRGCQNYVVYPVICFLALNLTLSLLVMQSDGRYLRPSDHGLSYQDTAEPTKETDPEMLSFFNNGKRVSLPEAKNLTTGAGSAGGFSPGSDPAAAAWWRNREKKRSRDIHKNHVREILLISSLVCGLGGVVLLVVSAFLFILRYRKQRPQLEVQRSKESKDRSVSTSASASQLPLALKN
ncbi:uncharacterized protein LOC113783182 [Coffea eugenioides]|uniref:Uncharacterized protein n=1 Tax=Coffea arabica TaxID=13443 RepID=A0A6P6U5H8_COFAR|nr:uncharacterized protein LOC113783182 [Coffea eugenioides]